METATSLVIGQLSGYMRGLTQRLDPGTGWYGEFLRRDPEGMRACLDGAAMPPWDVLESLLGDLAARPGPAGALGTVDPDAIARETRYAAGLRAAAVEAWDRLPGGVEELHTLLAAALAQRSQAQASLRALSARLDRTADPAQADALSRELSWTRDDAARAAARHEDLTARLAMAAPPAAEPLAGVPAQRSGRPEQRSAEPEQGSGVPAQPSGVSAQPSGGPEQGSGGPAEAQAPVGRAESRWLRGARRSGGARYAGAAVPEAQAFAPPPGAPSAEAPLRGARFGRPAPQDRPDRPDPTPAGGRYPEPAADSAANSTGHPAADFAAHPAAHPLAGPAADSAAAQHPPRDPVGGIVAALIALRAQGRSGEAHALLCEAAAGPVEWLPGLGEELVRAGLAADWTTLLWEAASLPPARFAAAAVVLGPADCAALLRQGAARPAAEIAEAALALGEAGRAHEADTLLEAFVRVRTAEESARLARRDPQWFAPRLLRAAEALSRTHHRDLLHALRVAKLPVS
ncbi:hypothetical protein [Streptomyces sp. NBC_00503]|uniref:hypothetical protein n=1 Tax=Streptomyces sp. NBC_00503 TaxID=2903659 RepID=UPI002E81040E|nr:hypothetical protein [Streptomyces sp. NBC_00503]WUD84445.1 hypothetical protein OG490_29960 [Streptomyces sp. NBC_00503]